METLTVKNARDGMIVEGSYSKHRGVLAQKAGIWYVLRDRVDYEVPDDRLQYWRIVEDAPKPPLVALDPQNPPELPAGHPDAAQDVLEALRPMVDEAVELLCGAGNHGGLQEPEEDWVSDAIEILEKAQSLLGPQSSPQPEPETEGQKLSSTFKRIEAAFSELKTQWEKYNG